MSVIRTVVGEIFGLFVDDGSFAVTILAWVAIVWALSAWLGLASGWGGIVLFAGLASILLESALRRARK